MKKIISVAILLTAITLPALAKCSYALPTTLVNRLTFTPPTTNVDGTPITDLKGYKVYWSTISGEYNDINSKDIGNPTLPEVLLTLVFDSIPKSGKYYFVITAYDSMGNESGFSNEAWARFFSPFDPPTNLQVK